jgi:hypothetical protein
MKGSDMGWLEDMAKIFFGGKKEPGGSPTAKDRDAAMAMDQLLHDDDAWEVGIDMGTIPETPTEYEGEDTDPDHPSVRPEPWYRKYLPF